MQCLSDADTHYNTQTSEESICLNPRYVNHATKKPDNAKYSVQKKT